MIIGQDKYGEVVKWWCADAGRSLIEAQRKKWRKEHQEKSQWLDGM